MARLQRKYEDIAFSPVLSKSKKKLKVKSKPTEVEIKIEGTKKSKEVEIKTEPNVTFSEGKKKTKVKLKRNASVSSSSSCSSSTSSTLKSILDEGRKKSSSLIDILQKSINTQTVSRLMDIRKLRERDVIIQTVCLKVAYMEEPELKKTKQSIVHVYLTDASSTETKDDLKQFGIALEQMLSTRTTLPTELNDFVLRATLWETTLPKVQKTFGVGDVIKITRVSHMSSYRGMLQFNGRLENVTK